MQTLYKLYERKKEKGYIHSIFYRTDNDNKKHNVNTQQETFKGK